MRLVDAAERIAEGFPAAERRRRERVPGASLVEVDGLLLAFANVEAKELNTVFVEREPSDAAGALAQAEHVFRRRRRPFGVDIAAGRHASVDEAVKDAGLTRIIVRPGMAAQIEELPDVEPIGQVDVSLVVDDVGATALAAVDAEAFEDPPEVAEGFYSLSAYGVPAVASFVAWEGEEPVGMAMSFLHLGAVGIFGVAVVARARRRGIGRALTLHAARAFPGADLAWLHPTERARPLYEGLGFETVATWEVWARNMGP